MSAISIFVGKLYVEGIDQGWSESYWLNATTVSAAKTAMAAIVTARKAMLHVSLELTYAYVSQLGVNRDSYICISSPQPGADTVVINGPNRLTDAILLRQESADGRVCNRYIHGVPDPAVQDGQYVIGAVAAFDTALAGYITALNANTGFLKKDNSTTPATLSVVTWGTIVERGLTGHKVGRPFDMRPGRRKPA